MVLKDTTKYSKTIIFISIPTPSQPFHHAQDNNEDTSQWSLNCINNLSTSDSRSYSSISQDASKSNVSNNNCNFVFAVHCRQWISSTAVSKLESSECIWDATDLWKQYLKFIAANSGHNGPVSKTISTASVSERRKNLANFSRLLL